MIPPRSGEGTDAGGWARRPVRFFQHLLREADAVGLDPAHLVAEARQLGAGGYICMGGGFSAWYPTRLASQTVNPYLDGDLLGGVLAAAREAGLRVLVRMDISKGQAAAIAVHPDWFLRDPDGAIGTVWDMPQICPTGPMWQTENFAILEEILSRYRVDGFFYNVLHVPRCHCARCQGLVRAATGAAVPLPGARSPAYERWRQDLLGQYTRRMAAFIAARQSGAMLVPFHHLRDGWDMRAMAAASGLISAQVSNPVVPNPIEPQPMWTHWAAEEALLARALKPGVAPLLIQSTSGFFASRQTALPEARLIRNLVQAAAHGAMTCPAMNGTLRQDDPRAVPALVAFGRYLAGNAEWYEDLRPLARIALVKSEDSLNWGPDAGRRGGDPARPGHVAEFRGLYEMLCNLHHPCDIVPAGGLTAAALSGYALLVLPAVSCLSDQDAAAIDAYVAGGGAVIATADTACRDRDGVARPVPALRCLPGTAGAPLAVAGAYFALADAQLRRSVGEVPHIGADGMFWPVAPVPETGADLRLIGPFANNAPEFAHVRGPGTHPGLLMRGHGAGMAMWLPWHPGALYHRYGLPDYRAVLGHVVRQLASAPPIATDAPDAVEFILYGHPRGAMLHALNGAAAQGRTITGPVPLAGFEVAVRSAATRAVLLNTGADLPLRREGAMARFRLDRLDSFAAVALTGS